MINNDEYKNTFFLISSKYKKPRLILSTYTESLSDTFKVIAMTETWLDSSNAELYTFLVINMF